MHAESIPLLERRVGHRCVIYIQWHNLIACFEIKLRRVSNMMETSRTDLHVSRMAQRSLLLLFYWTNIVDPPPNVVSFNLCHLLCCRYSLRFYGHFHKAL